jgi:hypothetical protein
MRMKLAMSLTAAALAVAEPASANPELETSVGYRWGDALLDGVDVHHVEGVHLDVGVRLRPTLLVYAEYDLLGMTYPAPSATAGAASLLPTTPTGSSGLEHRFGANARYALQRLGGRDAGVAFWLEGGLGVEHYVWDSGGVWTRPDFAVGLGMTYWLRGRHNYDAINFAVRGTFGPKNDVGPGLSCGGPCDTPTTASGWDRSITADVSLTFGR